jgi:hypothetical protein
MRKFIQKNDLGERFLVRCPTEHPYLFQRPQQILYGMDLRFRAKYLKDSCGLGGVVGNVVFKYSKVLENK